MFYYIQTLSVEVAGSQVRYRVANSPETVQHRLID